MTHQMYKKLANGDQAEPKKEDGNVDQAEPKKEDGNVEPKEKIVALGSGHSKLADNVKAANFATSKPSELSDIELEAEIELGVKRAQLRYALRSSIEKMEYTNLQREAIAARIEENNQMLESIANNDSLKGYLDRHKEINDRLEKALAARSEIAGQLPYSGMA